VLCDNLGSLHPYRTAFVRVKDYLAKYRLVLAIIALAGKLSASELPLRSFTTADGLADNRVHRIVSDSRGLLWMCTGGGISRFDGANFQSFGEAEGLPHPAINDLLETPDGDFWLASNGGGVIRFRLASAGPRYEAFSVSGEPATNRVNRLLRGPDGTVWAGTDGGLFRMTAVAGARPAFARVRLRPRGRPDEMVQVWSLTSDPEGSLWVGTRFGLVRILPGGLTISYAIRGGRETDHVLSLLYVPEDGLLWIGHQSGLAIFKPPPASVYGPNQGVDQPLEDPSIAGSQAYRLHDALKAKALFPQAFSGAVYFDSSQANKQLVSQIDLARSESGAIHMIAAGTVWEFSAGTFTVLSDSRLRNEPVAAAEDQQRNLWLATATAGVVRVARRGFITFRESDGLGPTVREVLEDHAGDLVAISAEWRISRFDGKRFQTVRVNIPAHRGLWGFVVLALEDHLGDWWFASSTGLLRFAHVRRLGDLAIIVPRVYTSRDGLAQDSVNQLFEDSRGDIWSASLIPGREVVTRWDRATGHFQRYSDTDGLRPFNSPTSFYEDPHGVLWITFRDGGIARYEGGRFRMLTESDGLPAGGIGGLLADHAGRLWLPVSLRGLYRIGDLNATPILPTLVATGKELHGILQGRMVEDRLGDIYVTTAQGVVRLDNAALAGDSVPAHFAGMFTTSDGLAGTVVTSLYVDRHGRLWVSTTKGVSYYDPQQAERPPSPQVRIGGVRIGGAPQAISPAGQQVVSGLELTPNQSQLEIEFFGISFATGERLDYQYRLIGGDGNWSAPSPLRSVQFSNLAPGKYDFEVRAISASGNRSFQPGHAAFRVLPPMWRQWWFLTAAGLLALSGLASFERYRAGHRREISRARDQRLAELEQVRQQIAADLHDEIGSSLTQISILSEVAGRQGAAAIPEVNQPLAAIATSSRELVDSMSDIVWAINPAKDHFSDLAHRMRRLATDTFAASDVALQMELPPPEHEIHLNGTLRREVYLIFKEAVTNMVKHSRCSKATIRLALQGAALRLDLRDNGKGFDPDLPVEGHGLISLRRRALSIGGSLSVVSTPGAGTVITLDLPLPT
jgi:signal transduction histidine kinase/ligand-binding sensor domain-containing protein